jgi:hypothetical protein
VRWTGTDRDLSGSDLVQPYNPETAPRAGAVGEHLPAAPPDPGEDDLDGEE